MSGLKIRRFESNTSNLNSSVQRKMYPKVFLQSILDGQRPTAFVSFYFVAIIVVFERRREQITLHICRHFSVVNDIVLNQNLFTSARISVAARVHSATGYDDKFIPTKSASSGSSRLQAILIML